jgi:hypothetical protein
MIEIAFTIAGVGAVLAGYGTLRGYPGMVQWGHVLAFVALCIALREAV